MSSTKPKLREALRKARLAMSVDTRRAKSLAIASGLLRTIDWSAVRNLHCYEAIEQLGEVDLSSFLADLRDTRPDIRVYTSKKINDEWQIVPLEGEEPISMPKFDAIIVPMLGFDTNLHRIGYGGGYYDKFLSSQPQAKKIGVCFELVRVDKLLYEPHDIPLDTIVTESKTYTP